MDKIKKIRKQLEELQQQKLEAEKLVNETKKNIKQYELEMAQYYQDFFNSKNNKEFILYDRFPSLEMLKLHIKEISTVFPLYEVGRLDVKELAELIKHFYQFQRGLEYDILTIGTTEYLGSPVYGGQSYSVIPHIYFIIGNNKTLEPFRKYNGQFINEDKIYTSIYLNARGKNIIAIELENTYESSKMNIECLTGKCSDNPGMINYYDYQDQCHNSFNVSTSKNIFDYYVQTRVHNNGYYGYKGIKDVLDFVPHISDTFIAKMLISVSIYKRNNNIEKLTSDDYNHIFDILFREKVDIKSQAKKDIPSQLVYVPNANYGR
ncbi:MAG: hypothetical protein PHN42_02340 [Bacilli bacterium]|nr:hypothetical protein [Bacilli bacterium]